MIVQPHFDLRIIAFSIAMMIGYVGCSNKTTAMRIQGTVKLNGQLLKGGELHLFGKDQGIGAIARIDDTGTFKLDKPIPLGTYNVAILPPALQPADPSKPMKKATSTENWPLKYQDPSSSGVTITIVNGTVDYPINFE